MRRSAHSPPLHESGAGCAPPRTLVLTLLALLAGCASAPETVPDPSPDAVPTAEDLAQDLTEDGDSTAAEDLYCVRNATVTVRVDNQSSMDLRVTFGSYRPARVAEGVSRTIYQIARIYLQHSVRLEVLRGGTQVGGPAVIPTEPVFCNVATLVIGARPQYSIFYGDALREPVMGGEDGEGEDGAEPAEEAEGVEKAPPAEPAPADSTSSDAIRANG